VHAVSVTYSILSADSVLEEVRRAFGLHGLETCQLLQRGLNDTYGIAGGHDRYVARVYGARWRSASDVAYEVELMEHLARSGIAVSRPVRGNEGLAAPLAAPEGIRQLVLFHFVDGVPLSWDEPRHCELAGRTTAALHAATDSFESSHPRFRLDLDYLIGAQLDLLRPFLDDRPEWRELERIAADLRSAATAIVHDLDWGLCHGDLAADNFRFGGDGTLSVLDLDLAASGWRAYDLAAVAWVATSRRRNEIWDTFIRGYADVRRPAAADLEAVPLFHAIRRLWSLGMEARNAPALGSYRLGVEYLEPELRSLREWQTAYGRDAWEETE
jgi:Ser/Thr protein kinase RdoA (MazF antagonist)